MTFDGGTLSGVTYEGTLDLAQGASLNVSGLTMTGIAGSGRGTITLAASSVLDVTATQTLNNAAIALAGDDSLLSLTSSPAGTLTLGSLLTLTQTGLNASLNDSGGRIVNDGSMDLAAGAGNFTIGATTVVNAGKITVGAGETLDVQAQGFTNQAGGTLTLAAGSAADLGSNWSNAGAIDLGAGAALYLHGAVSAAQIDGITNDGGTTYLNGSVLPTPQVVITGVTVASQVLTGQLVPVTWTLSNEGDGPATGPWSDTIYLASDAAGDNAQSLGSFAFDGTIGAGETITRQVVVAMPGTITGNEWFVVRTDSGNQLVEPLPVAAKQTAAPDLTVIKPAPVPNLVVTSITAPSEGFSGQTTQITWTVTNTGNEGTSASSWFDNVYLSLDQTLDTTNTRFVVSSSENTDTLLASVKNPTYLAPGESYTSTATVTLPQGISGPYYIIVGADAGGQVYNDPTGASSYTVSPAFTIQASPVPDLQVTSVVAPPDAFSGQPITLSWTVDNAGSVAATPGAWTDEILMSTDGSLDADSIVLGTVNHNGTLAVGASYSATATLNLPVGVGGNATFYVVADYRDQVYEGALHSGSDGGTATTTNVAITPPPDLVASLNGVPASAVAGHVLSFTYSVSNQGATVTPNSSWTDSVYLSSDPTLDANARLISSTTHYGALAVGQS